MKLNTLHDLFIHEAKDLYNAEKQLIKALPKMAKAATHQKLKDAFEQHLSETENHVTRLEQAFESMGVKPTGVKCEAMEGLIKEGRELLDNKKSIEPNVLDAALICAAQRVEHYEIAGYGGARTMANKLGSSEVEALLQQTLDEEAAADKKLTNLAKTAINADAMAAA